MSELTATETSSIYAVSGLETAITQPYPLNLRVTREEATHAIWGQEYVAKTIYEVGVPRRFQQLVDQWSKDTLYMSSIAAMVAHPSYLEIIAMGERAVPLLLRELEKAPNYWFPALTAITGEDPIPEEARGRLIEMTEAWLKWGRDNNYF